jgi:NAD(P)-dependent dehydrogenase (short-subunit alcohol dehydrogenase family)
MSKPLADKIALVAGGTRAAGRGIAVELGAAGATVYVTGRTTREHASDMNRPETIEETAELVDQAGGRGIPVRVDHLVPEQVRALVERIDREHGRLDILVNDIWGATVMEWDKPVWESTLERVIAGFLTRTILRSSRCICAKDSSVQHARAVCVLLGRDTSPSSRHSARVKIVADLVE